MYLSIEMKSKLKKQLVETKINNSKITINRYHNEMLDRVV